MKTTIIRTLFESNQKLTWLPPKGEGPQQEVIFLRYSHKKDRALIKCKPNPRYHNDDGLRWVFVERLSA